MAYVASLAAALTISLLAAQASAPGSVIGTASQLSSSPEDIPGALQKPTDCMVEAAKRVASVKSATRGITHQGGKAFVFVRVDYTASGGYDAFAEYSRSVDSPIEARPMFGSLLPGIYPQCDETPTGQRDCSNVRAWEAARHAAGPTPGAGPPRLLEIWNSACGVDAIAMIA